MPAHRPGESDDVGTTTTPLDGAGQGNATRGAGCDIAVVIPAHRQPGLLPEAIESVLRQRGALRIAAVVVDDGCPFPATRRVAQAYAARHPGRVFYLRRPNGGLSAARNTGVAFALSAWPGCRAVFPLDADNRLHPLFLQRAWDLLLSSPPEVGWVYPDVDMFGLPLNLSARGPHSALMHLLENASDAGSLIRREVFERGVRYDEAMREGFEDWDFWLQAIGAGFRGRHLPDAGFRYRRRPASMLSGAEAMRPALLARLRARHAALFAPRALLRQEHEEAPRTALLTADEDAARLFLDPAAESEAMPLAEARARFVRAARSPQAWHFPQVMAFAAGGGALEALRAAGLARNAFWLAETLLRDAHAVALRVEAGPPGEIAIDLSREGVGASDVAGAAALFLRTRLVAEAASDATPHWIEGIATAPDAGALGGFALIRVTLPEAIGAAPPPEGAAAARMAEEIGALRALFAGASAAPPAEWRTDIRPSRALSASVAERVHGLGGPLLPLLPEPGRRDIGFVLPLFDLGGVEGCVLNHARELRARGHRTHLFVTGARRIRAPALPALRDAFDSVNLLGGELREAADPRRDYFGARIPPEAGREGAAAGTRNAMGAALPGLLAPMQALVNTNALAAQEAVARLRRLGVRSYAGLHLQERGPFGQPVGPPQEALAYEHAYDGFTVVSVALRDRLIGWGVPRDKIHLVPNAPAWPMDAARAEAAMAERTARAARGEPLRALYLGRLDRQKGIDRLAALVARTQGPDITWRVVGKPVLADDGTSALVAALGSTAGVAVEPPAEPGEALEALYAWADVVVLPSRFEGAPLTLLEAQRMGCAVIASEVGAVAEIVAHGRDGLLVAQPDGRRDEDAVVEDFVRELRRLAEDRDLALGLGTAAAARVAEADWRRNMDGWITRLERELEAGPA